MKRWEAWLNHAGWTLVSLSGIAYGILKYFVASPDPNSRAPHPWASPVLAAHVLAAPVAVFALGLIFRRHGVAKLVSEKPERRETGSILLYLGVPLILSGYVVQVLTGHVARRWTGWAHAGLGVVYALGYLLHPLAFRSTGDVDEDDGTGP